MVIVAIHNGAGAGNFTAQFIICCAKKNVPHKLVDCFADSIINDLEDCGGLLWHWRHYDQTAALCAREITKSLEQAGKHVFPDSRTGWHYDDKVGQKYLLESIGAPLVPSHVFYEKRRALEWAKTAAYPTVFKLRGGAGAENVRLINDFHAAKAAIDRSFGRGWTYHRRSHTLNEAIDRIKQGVTFGKLTRLGVGVLRAIWPSRQARNDVSLGYAYFQEFVPGNDCDIRVVVIGDRAFAIKRMVRDGDFRASGSGRIVYDRSEIPMSAISVAFDVAQKLGTQSVAYDFVMKDGQPLIVEIGYAYAAEAYRKCLGYWDASLHWHDAPVAPEQFIVEDFIAKMAEQY